MATSSKRKDISLDTKLLIINALSAGYKTKKEDIGIAPSLLITIWHKEGKKS
jgi:hypothetical protein